MAEKRRFHRVPFSTDTSLRIGNDSFQGELLDISLGGALLRLSPDTPIPEAEQTCQLQVRLPTTDITMTFEVILIHREQENVFGFSFVGQDIETITHLRRLLELNIGNGQEVDSEFSHWLKE